MEKAKNGDKPVDSDAVFKVKLSNDRHLRVGFPNVQDADGVLVITENLRQSLVGGSFTASRVQHSKGVDNKKDRFCSLGNVGCWEKEQGGLF